MSNLFGKSVSQHANPLRIAGWSTAAVILLLPLVLMPFTDEVVWTAFDFLFACVLLLGTGMGLELAVRKTNSLAYRFGAAMALFGTLCLMWGNAAVGIIGAASTPTNVLYLGVPAVGVVGALVARFRAGGMTRALVGMALVHVTVPVLALSLGWAPEGAIWSWDVLFLTGFFAALFSGSAFFFRKAARADALTDS